MLALSFQLLLMAAGQCPGQTSVMACESSLCCHIRVVFIVACRSTRTAAVAAAHGGAAVQVAPAEAAAEPKSLSGAVHGSRDAQHPIHEV